MADASLHVAEHVEHVEAPGEAELLLAGRSGGERLPPDPNGPPINFADPTGASRFREFRREELEAENLIHHSAVIGPHVTMGRGNLIGPGAVILGKTRIGNGNTIRAYAVIGTPAEKTGHMNAEGEGVSIGSDCHISEHVSIHSGTVTPTMIGNRVLILAKAHIGHDSIIEDGVTISCAALVGGHSIVARGANLGLGCILHQFSRIGAWAFLGMGTVVPKKKKIVPGTIYVGNPARFLKNNTVGVQRQGVPQEELQAEIARYHELTKEWNR